MTSGATKLAFIGIGIPAESAAVFAPATTAAELAVCAALDAMRNTGADMKRALIWKALNNVIMCSSQVFRPPI
jgi:hypothetical protein